MSVAGLFGSLLDVDQAAEIGMIRLRLLPRY